MGTRRSPAGRVATVAYARVGEPDEVGGDLADALHTVGKCHVKVGAGAARPGSTTVPTGTPERPRPAAPAAGMGGGTISGASGNASSTAGETVRGSRRRVATPARPRGVVGPPGPAGRRRADRS